MKVNLILSLACTFTVFALGAGFQRVTVASPVDVVPVVAEALPIAASPRSATLPVLPTVYVVAHALDEPEAQTLELSGVMAGGTVGQVRHALVGRLGKGARRVGLAVPYYAFGGLASRPSE